MMKRIGVWLFYAIGAVAIAYLALYAYATFTGRALQPGDPIHIFRKPDAPDYSAATDGAFARWRETKVRPRVTFFWARIWVLS
jgi:hypothetical protein